MIRVTRSLAQAGNLIQKRTVSAPAVNTEAIKKNLESGAIMAKG